MSPTDHILNDRSVTVAIRVRARQLLASLPRAGFDLADFEQELALILLNRLGAFDGDVARISTFVRLVLDHGVVEIIRRLRARKRDCGNVQSLERIEESDAENGIPIIDPSLDEDLRIDLSDRAAALPAPLRAIVDKADTSVITVMQESGRSRSAVRRDFERLRVAFAPLAPDRLARKIA